MLNINSQLYSGLLKKLKQYGIEPCDIDELTDEIDLSDYKVLYEHYVNKKTYKELGAEYRTLNEKLKKKIEIIVTRRKVREQLDFLRVQNQKLLKEWKHD